MPSNTIPGTLDWRHLADADDASRTRALARMDAVSLVRRAQAAVRAAAHGETDPRLRSALGAAHAALADVHDELSEVAHG